jgi:hypothetical protein
MIRRALPLLAFAACTSEPTSWDNGGATAEGACQPQPDNALRFDCDLATGADGAVAVTVSGPDGSFTQTGAGDLTLVGVTPATDYTWTATADGAEVGSGSFTTGALPNAFDDISIAVSGSDGPAATMVPLVCDGESLAIAIGASGEVLWYQPLDTASTDPAGGISGFHVTADQTLLVHLDKDLVQEFDLSGAERMSASGFDNPLHHDLSRGADGRTYALYANQENVDGTEHIFDGFYVLDPGGEVIGTWDVLDHLDAIPTGPTGDMFWASTFPGATDSTHANAVNATPDGDVIVSFKAISTVALVAADPDASDFGTVRWAIDEGGTGALTGDVDVTSGGFSDQHHAHLEADGSLWLFDNSGGSTSATEVYDLTSTSATLRHSYDLGASCPRQGSAFELDDGSMLATCADSGEVMAFDEGAADPRWTLTVSCDAVSMSNPGGGSPVFARAAPISLR